MALDVAVSPEELKALLETGFLFRERKELDKAEEVFAGVIALRPDLEIAHLGLANIAHAKGEVERAEGLFRKMTELFPQSALAFGQLGEFLHTQGKKDAAVEALNKAISLDPSGPHGEAAKAIKALVDEGVEYNYAVS